MKMNVNGSRSHLLLARDVSLSLLSSLMSVLLVRWLSHPTLDFSYTVLLWLCFSLAGTLAGYLFSGAGSVISSGMPGMCLVYLKFVLIKEIAVTASLVTGAVSLAGVVFSVLAVLADTLLTFLLLCLYCYTSRLLSYEEVARVRATASRRNAVIMGTGSEAIALRRMVEESGRYNIVCFITANKALSGKIIDGLEVHFCPTTRDLCTLERRLGGVDCIFLSNLGEVNQDGTDTLDSYGVYGSIYEKALGRWAASSDQAVKRCLDTALSGLLLAFFSPLFAACAIAVKLEDGGPVIYRQERIGMGGKPFSILKFRSMRIDAEADGPQLWSGERDPRLTHTGAFLRRHHLDELPQLWNVFRGDMSFIGYRPERQCFIEGISKRNPRYSYLYQIRPGVTSYATLYNGYTDTMEKMMTRLDLDLYYLRHHSLAFDMRVLALTFLSIVSGKEF